MANGDDGEATWRAGAHDCFQLESDDRTRAAKNDVGNRDRKVMYLTNKERVERENQGRETANARMR